METAANLPGFVKVKLSYSTWDPVHIRSHVLKTEIHAPPPYIEDVSVWLSPKEVYPRLTAYHKVFDRLLSLGIVTGRATLYGFAIMEEDTTTLAYYEPSEDENE